jgi:hypothetical protein
MLGAACGTAAASASQQIFQITYSVSVKQESIGKPYSPVDISRQMFCFCFARDSDAGASFGSG